MAAFAGIDKAVPAAGDALGLGDDEIRALKLFWQEVFGIPDATTITNEAMNIAADGGIVINDTAADIDFRVEGDNNANMIVVDAGQDAISFGGANVDGAAHTFNNLQQRTFITSVGAQIHIPASQTTDFDNANGTIAIGANVFFGIPTTTNANATLTITAHANVYIEGIPLDSTNVTATTGYALFIDAGPSRIDGVLFMDENANANMATVGITMHNGTATDEFFAVKGTNVAHGVTGTTETDTFFLMKPINANGGIRVLGFEDAGVSGMILNGDAAAPVTTTATTTAGVIRIIAGTGGSGLGDTDAGITLEDIDGTLFMIRGNGDLHGVDTSISAFDEYDDVMLCRAYDLRRSTEGLIKDKWDEWVTYNEETLQEAGIIGHYEKGKERPLINFSQLTRLHTGAIWQLGKKMMAMEQKLLALETGAQVL